MRSATGEPAHKDQFLKMTTTPVSRLIIRLGIPTTLSMLVTNIYNMADSYFVSRVSLSAGGATGIVFGIMAILQAFGFMFGHGAGSNIGRLLGSRQRQRASVFASTAFFSALLCGVAISLLGIAFLKPLMLLLGSTNTILPHAMDYGRWIFIAAPAMLTACVMNNILRYEGKAALAMIGLTSGGIINIILDPILIFGLDMGIAGAGLATAISQYIAFGILLCVFIFKGSESRIHPALITRDARLLYNIITTGLPSLARQGLSSVSTMVLNGAAAPFGDAAIAAMSYVGRTSGLIFSVGLGIGQGYQPVVGYNYGAGEYQRVKRATLFTYLFGTAFMGSIAAVCFITAPQIISLFRNEAQVLQIGGEALRIQCVALLFFPISVVVTMLFQSIGKNGSALILSCLQSGMLFIPLCIILSSLFGIKGIEVAQPLAYTLSALVAAPMGIVFLKRLVLK